MCTQDRSFRAMTAARPASSKLALEALFGSTAAFEQEGLIFPNTSKWLPLPCSFLSNLAWNQNPPSNTGWALPDKRQTAQLGHLPTERTGEMMMKCRNNGTLPRGLTVCKAESDKPPYQENKGEGKASCIEHLHDERLDVLLFNGMLR